MSTYTQILYQIVFSTRNRERVLKEKERDILFRYISGIIIKQNCHLYRINGVEDHIHIITHLHPTTALANLVKDIKLASDDFIKRERIFSHYNGWQEGYGAFTYAFKDKDKLIEYVKNQQIHHSKKTFRDEFISLLKYHGIEFDEKYLL